MRLGIVTLAAALLLAACGSSSDRDENALTFEDIVIDENGATTVVPNARSDSATPAEKGRRKSNEATTNGAIDTRE